MGTGRAGRTFTDKQEGEASLAASQEPSLGPPGSHPPALCTSHFFLPWIPKVYLRCQQHLALLAEFHCCKMLNKEGSRATNLSQWAQSFPPPG